MEGGGHPYPVQVRTSPVWSGGTRKVDVDEDETGEEGNTDVMMGDPVKGKQKQSSGLGEKYIFSYHLAKMLQIWLILRNDNYKNKKK